MSFTLVLIGAGILITARSFFPALVGTISIGAGMGIANTAVFKRVPQARPPSFYSSLALIDSPYRDHEGYAPSELISE